ncbi:GPI biosynthesis protein Pig-F [Lophiotrema nucula]|uniref:GPI biosynthesis protein Pig-F n=1 Tax=Lophiotrema nucula TaxID=690887 RepID=A0A6A5YXN0_9PLEO|nr:GPI biosynthesis protein Pig-F [Lophiotrema nucula]
MSVQINTPGSKPKAPATPIETSHNDAAKTFTHIHPILVLSLYAYKFPSIVADPVNALMESLVWLGILQIAYVAVCLPPTGSANVVAEKRKPGERKRAVAGKLERELGGKIIPAFLSLTLSVLPAIPILFATLVLFGAPITTHYFETLLCAAHISLLAILPLVYVHGVDGERWREIVALLLPVDSVFGGMVGAFVGAWLGAVPIPLDW